MAAQPSTPKLKDLRLPMSRVKTIMKSSPHVESIAQDGVFLVTKATEMFIHYLSEDAHSQANKCTTLEYKHLAEVVQTNETLEFLKEIMPRKITVRQFKEIMAEKEASLRTSSSESSSDSDSDSQSDSDSSSDSGSGKMEADSSDSDANEDDKENGKGQLNKNESSDDEEEEDDK